MSVSSSFLVELVAFSAGLLSTISTVPQIVKIWKDKDTRAISLGMFSIASAAIFLWFLLGVLMGNRSMMFWEFVSLCLTLSVVFLKLRFSKLAPPDRSAWKNRGQHP